MQEVWLDLSGLCREARSEMNIKIITVCTCRPEPDEVPDIIRMLTKHGCTFLSYDDGWLVYRPT